MGAKTISERPDGKQGWYWDRLYLLPAHTHPTHLKCKPQGKREVWCHRGDAFLTLCPVFLFFQLHLFIRGTDCGGLGMVERQGHVEHITCKVFWMKGEMSSTTTTSPVTFDLNPQNDLFWTDGGRDETIYKVRPQSFWKVRGKTCKTVNYGKVLSWNEGGKTPFDWFFTCHPPWCQCRCPESEEASVRLLSLSPGCWWIWHPDYDITKHTLLHYSYSLSLLAVPSQACRITEPLYRCWKSALPWCKHGACHEAASFTLVTPLNL